MRDDFSEGIKAAIAKRVGHLCSNPDCKAPTSGPSTNPSKAINVGVAAHITGASQGGPRYDSTITIDERKHANNGIWLCQTCAKMIDSDEERFTVGLLRNWKMLAEQDSLIKVGKTLPNESENAGEVWELIKRYYPREVAYQLLTDSLTAINSFHPDYSVSASIKDDATNILIDRRNNDAPLINVFFQPKFPDSPEGLRKKQEYESFLETGSPVELDQSNVAFEQLPEVIQKIVPSTDNYRLYLGPSKIQKYMKMDIVIRSETGETFIFHALELKIIKSGKEEITFSNKDQGIPFNIEIRMKKSLHADISWEFNVIGQNAYWFFQTMLFQKIGSKCKKIELRDIITGIEYSAGLNDYVCEQEPSMEFMEIAQKLYFVQNKTKILIGIPNRDFTNADFDKIEWIENILKTGNQLIAPSNIEVTISATKENNFIASLLDRPGQSFSYRLPMCIERILDTDIPLGPVDLSSSSIMIHPEDVDKCRRFLNGEHEEPTFSIRLIASPGHVISASYLHWH